MQAVTTIALPIFALVASGYAARRLGFLPAPSVAGLNGFVYYFALPALLFVKVAETPILGAFDWRLLAAYHGAGLGVFALAMVAGRFVFARPLAAQGLQALGATFGNVGYMGLPIVLTAFGERAVLPSVLILVSDIVVTVSLAIAVIEAGLGRGGGWAGVARTVGQGLARNPLLLATVAGGVLSVAGLALPAPLAAFGGFLGAAALPCALFALGASLVGRFVVARLDEITLVVGLKLVIHPLAVFAIAVHGFDLDRLWTKVAMLEAALPAAATVFVLAQRYDVYVEESSAVVLLSTALSVATLSGLLALLAP